MPLPYAAAMVFITPCQLHAMLRDAIDATRYADTLLLLPPLRRQRGAVIAYCRLMPMLCCCRLPPRLCCDYAFRFRHADAALMPRPPLIRRRHASR